MSNLILEVTFTGLVLLNIQGNEGDATSSKIEPMLIDASHASGLFETYHRHHGVLSFYAEDIVPGTLDLGSEGVSVSTTPNGRQIISVDLDRQWHTKPLEVELEAESVWTEHKLTWFRASPNGPLLDFPDGTAAAISAMNWSPSIEKMDLQSVDRDAIGSFISQLPFGEFTTRDLILKIDGNPAPYEFVPAKVIAKPGPGPFPGYHKQAVANQVVMKAPLKCQAAMCNGLVIWIGDRSVQLRPTDRKLLQVSFTNLPTTSMAHSSATDNHKILHHLRWLAKLTSGKFDDVKLPVPEDSYKGGPFIFGTIQGKICPTVRSHNP